MFFSSVDLSVTNTNPIQKNLPVKHILGTDLAVQTSWFFRLTLATNRTFASVQLNFTSLAWRHRTRNIRFQWLTFSIFFKNSMMFASSETEQTTHFDGTHNMSL